EEGLSIPKKTGSFSNPTSFNDLPENLKELLGVSVAERTWLLGIRTGEMHIALASNNTDEDFKPEPFSLHYQRSLYSSLQSLVRSTYQSLEKNIKNLSSDIKSEAEEIYSLKDEVLKSMKKIYKKKVDVVKIRNHGDY